jgi:NodT family efflux transporter outer membrane factor (OMF) lipoprotein
MNSAQPRTRIEARTRIAAALTAAVTLTTALIAAALSACVSVPPAATPPPPLDANALGLHGDAVTVANAQWWQEFKDPQLDRLMQEALQGNPGLQETEARLEQARAQAAFADANRRPNAALSGSELRAKIPATFPEVLGGGHDAWVGDLGAAVDWDLDLFHRQRDLGVQAQALAQAADLDVQQARLLLTGAVSEAYVNLYRAIALADIAREAEAQRSTILDITRQRVAAGLDTQLELHAAESTVPQARVARLAAGAAQAEAVHALAALTGHGAQEYESISAPQPDLTAALPLPAQLPVNLLARRPDVAAARSRIEAADAQRLAARAAFYPNVNLRALAGFASFSLTDLLGASAFGYGGGAAFSLPVFDGGRLAAQYRGAQASLMAAMAGYNDTVVRAVRQTADQLSRIDALEHEIEQQRLSLDAAEQAYRIAEERYRAGLASYLSVLNAQTDVLGDRRTQLDLNVSLAMARITLLLAVGGSFDPSVTVAAR